MLRSITHLLLHRDPLDELISIQSHLRPDAGQRVRNVTRMSPAVPPGVKSESDQDSKDHHEDLSGVRRDALCPSTRLQSTMTPMGDRTAVDTAGPSLPSNVSGILMPDIMSTRSANR